MLTHPPADRIPDPLTLARALNEWVERHRVACERRGVECAKALADEALDLDEEVDRPSDRLETAFWKVRWLSLRQRSARFLRAAPSKRRRLAAQLLARAETRARASWSLRPPPLMLSETFSEAFAIELEPLLG